MTRTVTCELDLPGWLVALLDGEERVFADETRAMEFAVELATINIEQSTGGPFAALVLNQANGKLVTAGVNSVTRNGLSIAHAEIVAISLAQSQMGRWDLSLDHELTLVSTCEPCAMCYGALPWSGIRRLVCGARREDAEQAGFDEGDKPANWVASLQRRGIEVRQDLLRSRACRLFEQYRAVGGEMYNVSREVSDE